MRKYLNIAILLAILAIISLLAILPCHSPWTDGAEVAGGGSQKGELALIEEALTLIDKHYYQTPPPRRELVYAAIHGICANLPDGYSRFIPPPERAAEKEVLAGRRVTYGSVGLWAVKLGDTFVLKPIPGSPAEAAGIKEGEILLAAGGKPVAPDMSTDEVSSLLKGQDGTSIEVTVQTAEGTTCTIRLTRRPVTTPSVLWMPLDEVGLISLFTISETTPGLVEQAIRELAGSRGLILDLRHSPGGLLSAAVETTGCFLQDKLVCYERKREGDPIPYYAPSRQVTTALPLVVLIDEGTMSAAEILAAALAENGRAIVVGRPTAGKRIVQRIYELSDGSSIHLTESVWLTPRGLGFDTGIRPDVRVEGEGEQLERALRVFGEQP